MRPITLGSMRWIVSVCLLSGCYRPMMYPQQGYYGSPAYNNQYYGGYQGIQTLTPGQYYAPGTVAPGTYDPNGLQPTPDENSGGSGAGGAGNGTGGGDAPVYNPQGGETPNRPVPTYDGDAPGGDSGSGLEEPNSDVPIKENNSGGGFPGAMSEPVPSSDWADGPGIVPASMKTAKPMAAEATEETEPAATVEANESTEEVEEETPPLLSVPQGE